MDELRVRTLPPFVPALRKKFPGIGNIADRSIEPHVEHLALGTFHRHRDAPVQVAGYGARLETAVNPALALAIDIAPPLLVVLQNPLAQPFLILIQREIPVGSLFLHGFRSAELGLRIDEFFRAESAAAFLALVPIGSLGSALRAGSDYVPVSEESLRLRVVVLLRLPGDELALVIELAEEVRGILLMHLRAGTSVNVEIDTEARERVLDNLVILVHNILRRAALLTGLDRNRHTVFVAAAYIEHILSPHPEISDVDIRRHIDTGEMADVDRAVGIRQRTGHKCSFEFLIHIQ